MDAEDFQKLFEEAPGLSLILTPDLIITGASNAYLNATMTRREEITGCGLFDVFPDNPNDITADGVSNLQNSLNTVLKTGAQHAMPIQKFDIRRSDGSFEVRYWKTLNKPVLNDKKQVQYIIHNVEDVTGLILMQSEHEELHKANKEILFQDKQSTEKVNGLAIARILSDYKYALDESSIVSITDDKEIIKYANNNFCKISKYAREELIGQNHRIVNSGYHSKEFISKLWNTIKEGGTWRGELKNKAKDGSLYWVDTTIVAFLDEDEKPYQYIAISADITEQKNAEELLKESEAFNKGLLASLTSHIAVVDKNGCLIAVNKAWNDFAIENGATSFNQVSQGSNYYDVCKKASDTGDYIAAKALQGIKSVFKKETLHFELEYPCDSPGRKRYFNLSVMPFGNDDSKVVIAHYDITQRKLAEEKIIESENRLRKALDNMMEGVAIIGFDYRYHYINAAYEKQVNKNKEELLGYSLMEVFPGIEKTEIFKTIERCLNEGILLQLTDEYIFADGQRKWFDMSFQPVPEGVFILSVDVTENKKLQQQQVLFASIIDSTDDAVISKDVNGIITSWNKGAEKDFGYTAEEVIGKLSKIIPAHLQHEEIEIIDKIKRGEHLDHYETERVRKDGSNIYVSLTVSPVKDSKGNIIGISKISRNITEWKKSQKELLKANRLYAFVSAINQSIVHIKNEEELLIYACSVGMEIGKFKSVRIIMLDAEQRIKIIFPDGHHAFKDELQKYSGKDFKTSSLSASYINKIFTTGKFVIVNDTHNDPELKPFLPRLMQEGINAGASFPLKKYGKVVGTFSFLSTEKNIFDKEEIALLKEAVNDISFALEIFEKNRQHKEAQELLNRSESNLKAVLENTDATIYSLDRNFRYITFNQRLHDTLHQLYGVDVKPGDKVYSFLQKLNPEEAMEWQVVYTKALKGETVKFEKEVRIEDSRRYASFSINPIWENKKVIGLSCFAFDITKQKQDELHKEKMTADLMQRNKSLEQFSYIISHNLRTPIANILGLSAAYKDGIIDNHSLEEFVSALFISINKLDDVIKDLNYILQTKKNVMEKKEILNFSGMANDIRLSISSLIEKENAVISWNFSKADNMLTVKSYLHSIFYNLISNSLKYRRAGVQPIIEITSHKTNNKTVLVFKDNGMGIDLKKKGSEVFGLYKRFHTDSSEGKGMGLFMVKTQVETIGGSISISSEINKGTQFTIEFE